MLTYRLPRSFFLDYGCVSVYKLCQCTCHYRTSLQAHLRCPISPVTTSTHTSTSLLPLDPRSLPRHFNLHNRPQSHSWSSIHDPIKTRPLTIPAGKSGMRASTRDVKILHHLKLQGMERSERDRWSIPRILIRCPIHHRPHHVRLQHPTHLQPHSYHDRPPHRPNRHPKKFPSDRPVARFEGYTFATRDSTRPSSRPAA